MLQVEVTVVLSGVKLVLVQLYWLPVGSTRTLYAEAPCWHPGSGISKIIDVSEVLQTLTIEDSGKGERGVQVRVLEVDSLVVEVDTE